MDFKDGKIIGTKRLFADGKFKSKDGKATFMETKWRGLQAPGKEAEMKKWPFLINNGRTNIDVAEAPISIRTTSLSWIASLILH